MTLADFARYPLTFGPSPVHPLNRLSDHLGGARIWAKREDVSSGLAFGGNKVRKLEYLVPEALAQGADTLVSIGGVQSNHTRQVAAVAAHLGMKAVGDHADTAFHIEFFHIGFGQAHIEHPGRPASIAGGNGTLVQLQFADAVRRKKGEQSQ